MGNLFGVKRRAPQVTAQDRAILQLKQLRDKIRMYQKKTETDLEKNKGLALLLFQKGMKDRAIIVMRRKKYMEDLLTRTDKQLETLESLVHDIEYTQIEVSVVEGLRVGSEALKQLNSLMNIDEIHQMMEDNAEAAEKQREISAILSQTSERYYDDDLIMELEQLKSQTEPAVENRDQIGTGSDESKNVITSPANEDKPPSPIQASSVDQTPPDSRLDELPDVPTTLGEKLTTNKESDHSPGKSRQRIELA